MIHFADSSYALSFRTVGRLEPVPYIRKEKKASICQTALHNFPPAKISLIFYQKQENGKVFFPIYLQTVGQLLLCLQMNAFIYGKWNLYLLNGSGVRVMTPLELGS